MDLHPRPRLGFTLALVAALLAGGLAAVLLLAAWRGGEARAPALAGGMLRVGVAWLPPPDTPDMRPYTEEGFELELASDVAQRLGADLRLTRVAPDDAERALAAGEVDLVLARAGADDELRKKTRIVETGFGSGLSLAMRTDRPLPSWNSLKGRVVCAAEANGHARHLLERLGATVKVQRSPALALMHVRTGDCDAAIHDRALLDALFARISWQKFSATLPARETTALVAAVAPDHARLAQAVAKALLPSTGAALWRERTEKWAATVSFEVYRAQDAPDCH